jgi:hypothetical protein
VLFAVSEWRSGPASVFVCVAPEKRLRIIVEA